MTTIGIDLGTTNSLVAYWKEKEAIIIPNILNKNMTPSVVSIDENDEITINKIIQDLPNISELGIDELSFEDDKRKIQFYCNMLNQKKILAFRYPEKFLNNQSSLNVNRRIKEHM